MKKLTLIALLGLASLPVSSVHAGTDLFCESGEPSGIGSTLDIQLDALAGAKDLLGSKIHALAQENPKTIPLVIVHADNIFDNDHVAYEGILKELKARISTKTKVYILDQPSDDPKYDHTNYIPNELKKTAIVVSSSGGAHSLYIDSDVISIAGGIYSGCQLNAMCDLIRIRMQNDNFHDLKFLIPLKATYSMGFVKKNDSIQYSYSNLNTFFEDTQYKLATIFENKEQLKTGLGFYSNLILYQIQSLSPGLCVSFSYKTQTYTPKNNAKPVSTYTPKENPSNCRANIIVEFID